MASLFGELKRRNVFRVAVAYVVVGWIVIQVAETIAPLLYLPEWTPSFALFIGMVGFPFALLFAWAYELTPEGLKRSDEVAPEESVTHVTAGHINRVITVLLVIALAILVIERQWGGRSTPDTVSPPAAESTTEDTTDETSAAEAATGAPRSIAVLPFVNMSADPEQEYFSDGISEELLNALARINELRVAARTSSFAFKGQNQDITEIGKQLKVETVLEGSVRKSGQRVRITAQLINVADGYHLWSNTYDRDLTDIFAVQDEISAAIVNALRVHLATGDARVTPHDAVNIEAYNHFLRARHNLRLRTRESLELASQQFQQAIDIDPQYAAAWAGKSLTATLLSVNIYGETPMQEALDEAEALASRALELDPDLGLAHAARGLLLIDRFRYDEAAASLQRALAANPSEGILYSWLALVQANRGNFNEQLATLERAYRIDPLHPVIVQNLVMSLALAGREQEARRLVSPGSYLEYFLEFIANGVAGEDAASFRSMEAATRAPDAPRENLDYSMRSFTYFTLNNPELALQGSPHPQLKLAIEFDMDPARVWPELEEIPPDIYDEFLLTLHTRGLAAQGRYEEALDLLAARHFATAELHGNPNGDGDSLWLAWYQSYLLLQAGRTEESRALALRVLDFIQQAVANGEPGRYFEMLARAQLVLGEHDKAMASLHSAYGETAIDWTELRYPWWDPLREREDFRQLQNNVHAHVNRERAKLGWPPADFDP